jgi:preprotein translocase subunit SecG
LVVYLNIIQLVISIALVALLVMQAKGGGLSKMFGGEGSVYRSRRGVEKTVHNLTIGLIVVFVVISVASVAVSR